MVEVVIWVLLIIFVLWACRIFHFQNVKIRRMEGNFKRMEGNVEKSLTDLHEIKTKFRTAIEALERVGKDQMDK